MGIGDSSTDAGSSYNTPHSQHFVQAWVGITRQQAPGRDPMLDELDGQSLSSLSLSGTDPSVPDGGPDASIPPGNRARRVNYSSSRSSGPLEYEAPMHGSRSSELSTICASFSPNRPASTQTTTSALRTTRLRNLPPVLSASVSLTVSSTPALRAAGRHQ